MIPLSFAQLRLWFLAQLEGSSATYNVPFAWRLRGALDVDAVVAALNDVVARHESLRTVFPSRDGVPHQRVLDSARLEVGLGEYSAAAIADAVECVFDLSGDLPIRAWCFEVAESEHVLVVVVHHIAADGLSLGPLVRDLGVAYRARVGGAEPEFTPLPVQYVDYALWQRELLGERSDPSSEMSRLLEFWTAALDSVPEQLDLPADRARPAAPTYRGDVVDVVVDRSLHAGLAELAQSHGVTPFMVLQAAFATLLTRLGAGTDVPIGTPVAGRTDEALEDLVGFFVNTVVLRTDTAGDPSFVELLARVREADLAALDHQELPFEQVVEAVAPARSTAHHPLFQVMLTLEPADDGGGLDLPGIEARPEPFGYGVAKFDLTLSLAEHHDEHGAPAGVTGVLSFATDLFDRATVAALVQRFARVLAQAVTTPAVRLSRLDVLLPGEREQLLAGGAPVAVPAETLPALFQARVECSPDAVAVVCGERTVTYGELGVWVDRVAGWLVARGAGPERVVGVALPRSVELVVALLAVVKAGAAYLPIESGLPAERRRAMVDEARPVLIIESGTLDTIDAHDETPVAGPGPESPAYVIYTSGSTGRPKGVVVTHEAIVNRLGWMQDRFGLGADDRVLQKTPFGFDVSVWEFFWPLTQGATLVLAKPDGHRDPAYLARLIRDQRITTVHFVPSMLRAFLDEPVAASCDSVRRVICSGEALPADVRDRYFATLDAPLFNLYGPTEAAVDVTWWECRAGDPVVPIGVPVWNTSVYVLDPNLSPVPTGVTGELYLAGVQLARGYVAQPGLTADRFVADPFGPPGTRMYRTGDLVRRTTGGALVYLGRTDDQVKIRGQRIELDEISTVLTQHDGVDQAVVAVRDERLAAYVVPSADSTARRLARLEQDGDVDGLPRHTLPDGAVVIGRNGAEIEFLYREIFELGEYLRHGVRLNRGAVVFDVGAHVGMFSLFASAAAPDVEVFAFEPIPELRRELELNTTLHGVRATIFDCGLAERPGEASFTYYPQVSMLSGRFADEYAERAAVAAHALRDIDGDTRGLIDELIDERLRDRREVRCALRTVSEVIDDKGVARIDLLKVDAEKSELEILRGIRAEHWPRIEQVVVEVHDVDDRLDTITGLLKENGFAVATEIAESLRGSGLVNLFAVRSTDSAATAAQPVRMRSDGPASLIAELRATAAEWLPDYMLPADYVLLDAFPLSRNGKLDQRALPAPNRPQAGTRGPRNPREEILCGLFADLLGLDHVGIDDNFFTLGGHSLLAARLMSRIHAELDTALSVRAVFETPTVAGLADRLGAAGARPALVPADRPDLPALSFAQLRLWFLAQLEGPSATYNVPLAWRLRGADPAALVEALNDVVARHESLRTVFPSRDGVPHQRVLDGARLDVVVGEYSAAAIADAVECVFDLSRELPVRAWCFEVSESEQVLVVVVHHIAADGLSLGPLVRDLGVAYRARVAGVAPEFVPLPVQYVDYALWQRELLGERSDSSSEMSRLLEFWTGALDGVPEQLELPADRPRPATPSYRGATADLDVTPSVHAGLVDLAQSHGATPFMVLHAALATLLTKLGAGTDIPVGFPVAGRTDEALEELVGFFVNTVVLRTDTSGDPTFEELLARVREAALAALDHQELPFEQLVDAMSPTRSTAHHPLFQVMLTLDSTEPGGGLDLPGVEARPEPFGHQVAKFDITAALAEHHDDRGAPAGITGVLALASDLFDQTTVDALGRRLTGLLEHVVARPDAPLSEVDVLLPGEREQLLAGGAPVAVPAETLPALFQARVECSPDAVAVVCGERTVTYGELGVWVDRVAGWLVARGAGPERVVGVALPRSVELVVALLAVVKAGAAYLPIESGLPAERRRAMVDEARPVLIIESGTLDTIDAHDETPVAGPGPESPAYVIYTSGSTGRPKGVVVTHEAIVNRLGWMQDRFGLGADDRVLQKTPFGFDVSVWEFFWPLTQGATLVLAKPDGHRDPAYLARLIRDQRITTVHFVPSMLRAFLDEPVAASCDSVRRVICSGEALPADVRDRYFATLDAPLFNLYGPTEAAVDVTWWECRAGDPVVPIGVPVWNTTVYVLDPNLSPVPIGVAGELYLAGVQLARGYVAQPGLTADRFVADPFGPPGTRMYRTGDLVRRTADGALVYLGRTDDQVKIRGRRIELGEIGTVLGNHHHVDQATVIARDNRLVAYVIPGTANPDGPASLVDELRATAAEWLPDYMLPSEYVLVDAFPLSRNGKLNHRALPAPARPQAGNRGPRNPREEILCGLFADLLGLDHVGIDDNFFALGGHSLLAAALIASAPVMLGRGLSVADVFRAPTVAQLAALTGNDDLTEVVLRIRPEGERPPLFLVHPGIGLSWCYAGFARRLPDVPLYGLQARGVSAPERMPASLAEMAEDYLAEVRAIQPHGPYRLAGWSFGGNVAHLMATLLQQRGEEVTLLALLDSYPFAGGHEASTADVPTPADPVVVERELARSGMDSSRSERFAGVLAHHTWLAERCTPGVFRGDLVFFRANDHGAERHAETWERFVSGTIRPHPVDAGHFELLRAEPLAQIAEVLDRLT